jgi:hypothetical protein
MYEKPLEVVIFQSDRKYGEYDESRTRLSNFIEHQLSYVMEYAIQTYFDLMRLKALHLRTLSDLNNFG